MDDVEPSREVPDEGTRSAVAPAPQGAFVVVLFAPSWVLDHSLWVTWSSVLLAVAATAAFFSWLLFASREKSRRERVDESLAHEQAARQEAEEALYTMAHDLKTPLVTLDHLVEEIDGSHRGHSNGGFDKATADTRKVLRHMGDLVDQMLSYAQGVPGSMTEGHAPVDQTVQEVADMLRSECESRRGRLMVEGGPDAVLHMAPEALRHVLLNLMENAVKYGPDHGPVVRVSWSKLGRGRAATFVLEVADNGDGVPVEQRDQVFRLLQRFPDRRGRKLPGSGVGLAVVRRILHQQGARVEIDDAPEGGALFRVVYPQGLWDDLDVAQSRTERTHTRPESGRRTVGGPSSLSRGPGKLPALVDDP